MPQPFPWLQPHEVPYAFPVKRSATMPEHAPNEGELAVDVFETEHEFFVSAPIAGVDPALLDVAVTHDTVTIRGERAPLAAAGSGKFLAQECHWGKFSRTVILPESIKTDETEASFHGGVLVIRLPKNPHAGRIQIRET